MSETIQLKSTYEGAEVYATDPLVAVRSNVISPIECAYLIELAKPHIKRAGVVLDDGYKPSDGRTGSNHWGGAAVSRLYTSFASQSSTAT